MVRSGVSAYRTAVAVWVRSRLGKRPPGDLQRETATAYAACQPRKFVIEVRGADHFSFGQQVFRSRRAQLDPAFAQAQADVIRRYAAAFMLHYLAGDVSGAASSDRAEELLPGHYLGGLSAE